MKRNHLQQLFAVVLVLALTLTGSTAFAQNDLSAKDIVSANIEATGGLAAWRAVKDMHAVAEIGVEIPGMGSLLIKLETTSIFPGYGYTSIDVIEAPDAIPAEQINQKAYYTPLEGWVEGAGGRQDINSLSPQQRNQFQRSSPKNELDYLAYSDSLLVRQDDRELDGKPVYAIEVTTDGATATLLYDMDSFMLVAQESMVQGVAATPHMSNFMDIDGL